MKLDERKSILFLFTSIVSHLPFFKLDIHWLTLRRFHFCLNIQPSDFDLILASKYSRPGPKKVTVPKRDEKPIMGLVSDKNFIVSNAVENILAAPKLPVNNEKDYLKKKNYGKVPKFLQNIKQEIEDEY